MSTLHPESVEPSQAVLLAVGELIGREIALDHFVRILVDRITQSLSADRGTLYFIDPAKGELFSKAAHLPELHEIRLKLGQGVAGRVAQTGNVINLHAPDADGAFFSEIDRQTGYTSRSILAAPLRDRRGRIFGVLQVLNKTLGPFTLKDEQTIANLSAQAAIALESTSLYLELRRAEKDPGNPVSYRYNKIIGESEAMRSVYRIIDKAAPTSATVLIRGESGTGKELIARAIQVNGSRRSGPFIKVDCAALPPSLIENELFGHEKGAYTGAGQRAIGRVEAAHGGTLFLDELGELPLSVQGRLLRVLQEKEIVRVGGHETLKVDVRFLAATNRDLEQLVEEGLFRADLYYRIRVVELTLPPLRERGPEDIRRLVEHFAVTCARRHGKEAPSLTPRALERLLSHPWPGNVRELEHCMESAVIMAEGGILDAADLALPTRVLWRFDATRRMEWSNGQGAQADQPPPLQLPAHSPPAHPAPSQQPPVAGGVGAARDELPLSLPSARRTLPPRSVHRTGEQTGGWRSAQTSMPSGERGFQASTPYAEGAAPASQVSSVQPVQPVQTLEELERRHILQVLEFAGYNQSQAAKLLGIGRNTLGRKLKEYGIASDESE